jgi:hypothetical protein
MSSPFARRASHRRAFACRVSATLGPGCPSRRDGAGRIPSGACACGACRSPLRLQAESDLQRRLDVRALVVGTLVLVRLGGLHETHHVHLDLVGIQVRHRKAELHAVVGLHDDVGAVGLVLEARADARVVDDAVSWARAWRSRVSRASSARRWAARASAASWCPAARARAMGLTGMGIAPIRR